MFVRTSTSQLCCLTPSLASRSPLDTSVRSSPWIPLSSRPIVVLNGPLCSIVGACLCLSGIPAFIHNNPILHTACLVVGTPKVTNYITGLVSQLPFFAPPVPPPDRIPIIMAIDMLFAPVGNLEGKPLQLP